MFFNDSSPYLIISFTLGSIVGNRASGFDETVSLALFPLAQNETFLAFLSSCPIRR